MDARLATSFFFGQHEVFGYRLKPFCLLHSVQLESLDIEDSPDSPAPLIVAAQICSSYQVRVSYRRHPLRRLWRSFELERAKWDAYFADSTTGPLLFQRPSEGGLSALGSPWQQVMATRLQKDLGLSYREAWTLPEGRIKWEYYSLREQTEEDSMILGEDQQEAMTAQAQWEEDHAATIAAQSAALTAREESIARGEWPLDERGRPVPMNFKTLLPDV